MPELSNSRYEVFAQHLFAGDSQRQAFLAAYPKQTGSKPSSIDTKACVLANRTEVAARVAELHQAAADAAIATVTQRKVILSNIAKDEAEPAKNRIHAVDVLNKMDAVYVQKMEATVSAPVSEIADKVKAILDE